MVVFTCNNCGDSVSKPRVEKHINYECKRKHFTVSFCCVDCLKDFNIDTVKEHCQCITEEQRYSAKGFVPKASAEKGKRKQASWVDIVQLVIDKKDLQNDERQFLSIIAKFDNVPRKKNKFQNFCFSTAPAYRQKGYLVDKVFDMIEAEYKAQLSENSNIKTSENVNSNQSTESTLQTNITTDKCQIDKENNNIVNSEKIVEAQLEKKKKKKVKNSEFSENNSENLSKNVESSPEKNKNKKHTLELISSTSEHNPELIASVKSVKKTKKKKKSLENSVSTEENGLNNEKLVQTEKKKRNKSLDNSITNIIENGHSKKISELIENEEIKVELSKKEKKALKKKLKYKQEVETVTNGVIIETPEPLSKKKKRKLVSKEDTEEPQQKVIKTEKASQIPEIQNGRKFKWNEAIFQIIQCKKGKPISINKIKKKVMNEYHFFNESTNKSESDLEKLFLKKLKKLKNVQIDNDKVQLIEC
ncbi:cell growth-regulating nucleolar protein [Daktulosphaira vitifoliae]|uniref:cell growth-regulating nucleolar protein n=1 Tax=Daktulosphaira vitifoliae TaxID=58002 RepID=UPI0021A9A0FC|nr:cell growth-regulating nucleolar protein [Daktulosphaira vitifoliae]XP_050543800.1 cell growth-regulating nucleolar protein [Daktulosphaira vitifoliae]XP_050543801.1 cell growth-regulating nucleolar protein [Daktulosphaira vitifoliae]